MYVYLYYFVPDWPVTDSVPQSGMSVMPTGQELRFGGMDGQSPELISVTLQRSKTNGRSLTHSNHHAGAMKGDEPGLLHAFLSVVSRPPLPLGEQTGTPEAQEGCVSVKRRVISSL